MKQIFNQGGIPMPKRNAFRYALRHSFPIFIGWIPVGLAYGMLMHNAGYHFLWTGACSLIVFAGSLQFLMVSFFTGSVSLLTVAVMALLVNSRHIFYGLSFIEKFRSYGGWKYFLIYTLSDENYSLHCSLKAADTVDEKWAHIFTAALVAGYWVILSIIGNVIGALIPFDMTGIDFAMTALFVVILIDQLRGADNRLPAIIAAVSSVLCLFLFGADGFILPALLLTVAALTLLRHGIAPADNQKEVV